MITRPMVGSTGFIGVDVGHRQIRLLQVRVHRGRLETIGAAQFATDRGLDLESRFRSAVASGGFSGRRCVVSLPRDEVFLQSIRMPCMRDDELQEAVAWEVSQRLGVPPETIESDFLRTGVIGDTPAGREEVLLVGVTHEALGERMEAIMASGLRPLAVDTHFGGLARLFGRLEAHDDPGVLAIVEVGWSGATMIVLQGGHIAFCKPIEIGGRTFDEAVAAHLCLEPEDARELREARISSATMQEMVTPFDEDTDRAIDEAVRPAMGALVREVVMCLRYYGVTFRGRMPTQVVLTGGDGLEPRLARTLQEACRVPVVHDLGSSIISDLSPGIEQRLHRDPGPASCWTVAAGLSLRGIDRGRRAPRAIPARLAA